MKRIQYLCRRRGITRLCHFTQSRNLGHIFGDTLGILPTKDLKDKDLPHNPTDPDRYDGREDLICCSIECPNSYYFTRVRNNDFLFRDWVVLLIEPHYLWHDGTHFCPCNAARLNGNYIELGTRGFNSLFSENSPGSRISRSSTHLRAAPTDIQAEVLVEEFIRVGDIIGIVFQSEEQAKCEIFRLKLQGVSIDQSIYVAPDLFLRDELPKLIRNGVRATEIIL